MEEDQNHERKTLDCSSSPTLSYNSSHPRIEHEGENVKQTYYLQTHHAKHQNHALQN
jgi:hypothetical protein